MMTKNEHIASILLEAAELLKNDPEQESLNEGINGIIVGAIAGFITIYAIISKIKFSIKKKKFDSETHYLKEMSKFHNDLVKVLNNAKFISYHKNLKDVLSTNSNIIKTANNKLKELDNCLYSIKTKDEFYSKKDKLIKQYDDLYENTKKSLAKSNERLTSNSGDWVENDKSIISLIEEYIKLDGIYYRNLDGDDYWEAFDLLKNLTSDDPESEDGKLWDDTYDTLTSFPEYIITDIDGCIDPLKYIKVRLK